MKITIKKRTSFNDIMTSLQSSTIPKELFNMNSKSEKTITNDEKSHLIVLSPINAYYTFMKSNTTRKWINHLIKDYPHFNDVDIVYEKIDKPDIIDVLIDLLNMAPNADYADAKNVARFITFHSTIDPTMYTESDDTNVRKSFDRYMKEVFNHFKVLQITNSSLTDLENEFKDLMDISAPSDDNPYIGIEIKLYDAMKTLSDDLVDLTPKNLLNQMKKYMERNGEVSTENEISILIRMRNDIPYLANTIIWLITSMFGTTKYFNNIKLSFNEADLYDEILHHNNKLRQRLFKRNYSKGYYTDPKSIKPRDYEFTIANNQSLISLLQMYQNNNEPIYTSHDEFNQKKAHNHYDATTIDVFISLLHLQKYDTILNFDKAITKQMAINAQFLVNSIDDAFNQTFNPDDKRIEHIDEYTQKQYRRRNFLLAIMLQIMGNEHELILKTKLDLDARDKQQNIDIEDLMTTIESKDIQLKTNEAKYEKSIQYWQDLYKQASDDLSQFDTFKQKINEQQKIIISQETEINALTEKIEFLENQQSAANRELAYQTDKDLQDIINDTDFTETIDTLNQKNVVIIGGHESWVLKMRNILPNAFIHTTDILNRDISRVQSAEYIIINTSMMNHPMYHRIKNEVNKRKTPLPNPIKYINATSSNVNRTLQLINDIM